jgi:ferritin-like protein
MQGWLTIDSPARVSRVSLHLGSTAQDSRQPVGEPLREDQQERRMASDSYHEPLESLSEETRNLHRAIVSLMEELEAIDWYQQRSDACTDPQLRDILAHNRDEEIEHAAMVMEWLRRHNSKFDEMMKKYLFTEHPVTAIEDADERPSGPTATETLGIGSLKGR